MLITLESTDSAVEAPTTTPTAYAVLEAVSPDLAEAVFALAQAVGDTIEINQRLKPGCEMLGVERLRGPLERFRAAACTSV